MDYVTVYADIDFSELDELLNTQRSIQFGRFDYSPKPDRTGDPNEDDAALAEWDMACLRRNIEVHEEVLEILNDHGIDTTHVEVRCSEDGPGTIRILR